MIIIKLLIVDDESFTREGIIEMIPWKNLGIEEIKQAFDGINALEILENYKPDILLTDVRMPRMNGIDLAYKVRELYDHCSIIFMSGYSDKEYLKSAIHLKAISYVEKPIELDELESAFNTAILEISKVKTISHTMENNIAFEIANIEEAEKIHNLINSYFSKDFINSLINCDFVTVLIKVIDSTSINKDCFIDNLRKISILYEYNSLISFKDEKEIILHLFFPKNKRDLNSEERFNSLFSSFNEYINKFSRSYLSVGPLVTKIDDIHISFKGASNIMKFTFFHDYNTIIHNKDVLSSSYLLDGNLYYQFDEFLEKENKQSLILLVKNLTSDIKQYEGTSISYIKDIYYQLILKTINFSKNRNIDVSEDININYVFDNIVSLNNIYELSNYTISKIEVLFNHLGQKNTNSNSASKVIKYINENYSDPSLSLDDISKYTYLTPAYICVIFKDFTGKTVNKYLNEYRITTAKNLLKDPNIKMTDIASKVGYRDGNYFAKTFKKETGYSPSEYRRKFI